MNIKVLYNLDGWMLFFVRLRGLPRERKINSVICRFSDNESTLMKHSDIGVVNLLLCKTQMTDTLYEREEVRNMNLREYMLLGFGVRFNNYRYNKKTDELTE